MTDENKIVVETKECFCQSKWFKKLFYLGLGEFRYINNINIPQNEFVEFISEGSNVNLEKIEKPSNDTVPMPDDSFVPTCVIY